MSQLSAFLNPVKAPTDILVEVVPSERFKESDGTFAKWKIQPIDQDQNEDILERCRKNKFVKGQNIEILDRKQYHRELVLATVKYPDLRDVGLCDKYHVKDPAELAGKMLIPGEYNALLDAIMDACGFNDEENEKLLEEAKNSSKALEK